MRRHENDVENSRQGLQDCLQQNYSIETDIQAVETSKGIAFYLFHDAKINDSDFLRDLSPETRQSSNPTLLSLDELFEIVQQYPTYSGTLNLELKAYQKPQETNIEFELYLKRFSKSFLQILQTYPDLSQLLISSFHAGLLDPIQNQNCRLARLIDNLDQLDLNLFNSQNIYALHLHKKLFNETLISQIRAGGFDGFLGAYTVNTLDELTYLEQLGAQFIFTDNIAVLKSRKGDD